MDAQADLSLRWAQISFCLFCHDVAQIFLIELSNHILEFQSKLENGGKIPSGNRIEVVAVLYCAFLLCRYILVDWLAEVAAMKEFSSLTFHVAVSVVDRFLRVHPMTRSRLQLLGVSAMVLCSRYNFSHPMRL